MASEQLQSSSTSTDKIPAAHSPEPQKHSGTLPWDVLQGWVSLPATLSPLCTPSLGISLQTAHPERGVCPAPSLLPQMVTSASCQPAFPQVMLQTPLPMGTTTSSAKISQVQLYHLALGCSYPHFSGQKAASSTLSRKEPRLHLLQRVSFSIAPQPPRP